MNEQRFEIREGSLEYIQSKASLYKDIVNINFIEPGLLRLCVKDVYDDEKIMEFIDNYVPLEYKVHLMLARDCDNLKKYEEG